MRKVLAKSPDPIIYDQKCKELSVLKALDSEDYIDLYFADESSFSLTPQVPYGWQERGEKAIGLPSQRSKHITTFGLITRDNHFEGYTKEGSFKSQDVINSLDDFVSKTRKKTVIVMDNAPIHKSKIFKEKMKDWEKKEVYIWFLPTYSPHLNIIEILWKRIKYSWLKPINYSNWNALYNAINFILLRIGTLFKVTFTYDKGLVTTSRI